jgi:hypothetical protein
VVPSLARRTRDPMSSNSNQMNKGDARKRRLCLFWDQNSIRNRSMKLMGPVWWCVRLLSRR